MNIDLLDDHGSQLRIFWKNEFCTQEPGDAEKDKE